MLPISTGTQCWLSACAVRGLLLPHPGVSVGAVRGPPYPGVSVGAVRGPPYPGVSVGAVRGLPYPVYKCPRCRCGD